MSWVTVVLIEFLCWSPVNGDTTEIASEVDAESEQTDGLHHRPLERVVVNA